MPPAKGGRGGKVSPKRAEEKKTILRRRSSMSGRNFQFARDEWTFGAENEIVRGENVLCYAAGRGKTR